VDVKIGTTPYRPTLLLVLFCPAGVALGEACTMVLNVLLHRVATINSLHFVQHQPALLPVLLLLLALLQVLRWVRRAPLC
jgi:hypothetical protein